jgi:hypothetical protein
MLKPLLQLHFIIEQLRSPTNFSFLKFYFTCNFFTGFKEFYSAQFLHLGNFILAEPLTFQ